MATGYILYNEKAGTGKIADAMQALKAQLKGELKLVDVLKLTDYAAFVQNLTEKDYVVVAGGDFELAGDGLLKVPYLENDANVRVGDTILTNGGAYPPDLILGRVTEVRQESHGISSYAAVEPAVNLDELSTVFVVKSFSVEN